MNQVPIPKSGKIFPNYAVYAHPLAWYDNGVSIRCTRPSDRSNLTRKSSGAR